MLFGINLSTLIDRWAVSKEAQLKYLIAKNVVHKSFFTMRVKHVRSGLKQLTRETLTLAWVERLRDGIYSWAERWENVTVNVWNHNEYTWFDFDRNMALIWTIYSGNLLNTFFWETLWLVILHFFIIRCIYTLAHHDRTLKDIFQMISLAYFTYWYERSLFLFSLLSDGCYFKYNIAKHFHCYNLLTTIYWIYFAN